MSRLPKLFSPVKVGKVELKNRVVMLPVTTNYADHGRMTQRQHDFYVERAKGGAGLICFGFMPPVSLHGTHAVGSRIHTDEAIPELRQLADSLHSHGAKVLGQLTLRYDWRKNYDSPLEPVAPTGGVVTGPGVRPPRELSVDEIGQIVEQFAQAARRCREAGFDMVEFHCGLGYLINRFISPATNKRTDGYGGSLENRLRFLLEIIQRSRERAGQDYTFGCRISAEEFIPGGHTIEESKQVARILEQAGVHLINVQAGWLESPRPLIQSSVPQGAYAYLAEEIKKVVSIPVVAAYRINDPLLAERIVSEGRADLIGMCRALIADPELPNKAREGRLEAIRPCIACCECLDSQYIRGEAMGCSVNPWVGSEGQASIEKAARPGRVFIVGAGPAGMQAAIVASQRGHQVTLFDKGGAPGGQLIPASKPPYKEDIAALARYLYGQVEKAGVTVKHETKVTAAMVAREQPDAVVLATGADPVIPDVPGNGRDHVLDPIEVLMGRARVGQNVLVVGGGLIGCETAELLAGQGKKVTLTTRQDRVGNDIGPSTKWVMRKRLQEAGVIMKPRLTLAEVTGKGAWFKQESEREFIEADTIVIAAGMRSQNTLASELNGKVSRLFTIGDCAGVGRIRQAIEDGARAGMEV